MESFTLELADGDKARLKALADKKSAEGLGTVSMGRLGRVAMKEYLDREEGAQETAGLPTRTGT